MNGTIAMTTVTVKITKICYKLVLLHYSMLGARNEKSEGLRLQRDERARIMDSLRKKHMLPGGG